MPLIPLRGQPILLGGIDEKSFACPPTQSYCTVYKYATDAIRGQIKQTPCGSNLVCNPTFETNTILSDSFILDPSTHGWFLSGNMAWWSSINSLCCTGGGNANYAGLLTPTLTYTVKYRAISGKNGTQFQCTLGGGTPGATITLNAGQSQVITQQIVCGIGDDIDLSITGAGAGTGERGEITYILITQYNCWTREGGWGFSNGMACHTSLDNDSLHEDVLSSYAANDYFVVTLSVFGMTTGSLKVYVGGTVAGTITQNGDYIFHVFTALTDTLFSFLTQGGWTGCVSTPTLHRLLNLADIAGHIGIYDANDIFVVEPVISLIEDRINFVNPADLSEGCYTIKVVDPCIETGGTGTEINSDVLFNSSGAWSFDLTGASAGSTGVITGGECVFTVGGVSNGNEAFSVIGGHVFPNGTQTYVFQVIVETGNFIESVTPNLGSLAFILPNGISGIDGGYIYSPPAGGVLPNTVYTKTLVVTFNNNATNPLYNKFAVFMDCGGCTSNDQYKLKSLSVKITPVSEYSGTLESNCLKVQTDTDDYQIVRGVSDEDRSLGFVFSGVAFPYLESRLGLSFLSPHSPNKTDSYLYSTGLKKRKYAQVDKMWDLVFWAADENMHDCINNMINSDHLLIGLTSATLREYIADEKSYAPSWGERGDAGTAESTIEVGRISGTTFNLNA